MKEPTYRDMDTAKEVPFSSASSSELRDIVNGRAPPLNAEEVGGEIDIARRYAAILLAERGQ